MIVEFSVIPMGGSGEGISGEVAKALKVVEESGLPYQLTAMGTLLEGSWDEVMDVIRRAHDRLRESHGRVYTRIVIDDREGSEPRLEKKVAAVRKHLSEM